MIAKNISPLEFNLPQNENSSFWKLVQGLLPWGDGCGGGVKNGASNYNNPTTTTTFTCIVCLGF